MSRTRERALDAFEDEPQDAVHGVPENDDVESDAADVEAAEAPEGAEAAEGETGELATVPFVGGDAYDVFYEGGIAAPGVKPPVPETGTEDAVRLYLKSIGRVPLL